jgi:hypothetical protein
MIVSELKALLSLTEGASRASTLSCMLELLSVAEGHACRVLGTMPSTSASIVVA